MIRRRLIQSILAGIALPAVPYVFAAPRRVSDARVWQDAEKFRLVFDTTGPTAYNTFSLQSPDRIVIDLTNAELATALDRLSLDGTMVRAIRSGPRAGGTRIVLELNKPATLSSFALAPADQVGHRLVFDLHPGAGQLVDTPAAAIVQQETKPAAKAQGKGRDIIVVVDAGHGGRDPGAVSPQGHREKDVALLIAQQLAKRINRQPGFKARLVRNEDFFVPLRKRVDFARQYNADMFVSVHADAAPRRAASGASVFALSEGGATSTTARWLANRENEVDLIGAEEILKGKDKALANVLLDMSMNATIASSLDLGKNVLGKLSGVTNLHQKRVEQAGFAVLKSPDIPSILVETGFMSNARDCRKLRTARHQQVVAGAIFDGLHDYFRARPPIGSYLASLDERSVG
ncbi:N-acetylmuramoyl-L-alanine amidase [Pseudomonas sp. Marseille-QA0892]